MGNSVIVHTKKIRQPNCFYMRGLLYCYYYKDGGKGQPDIMPYNRDINHKYIVVGGCHEKRQYF